MRIRSTDDYGPAGNVSYASRENANASIRPQLILTFENSAPSISGVADQAVNEDTSTAALGFTVGDDFTPAASLTVTAVSSNTALVPDFNIILNGDGADRTIVLTPAPDRSGSAVITLTVSDGSLSSSETFLLTVNAVEDPPVANPGIAVTPVNQAVDIDLRSLASDSETPDSGLRFNVSGGVNGTVTLLADGHTARFFPASQFSGPAGFTYSVTDATLDPRILVSNTVSVEVLADTIQTWRQHYFQSPENAGSAADAEDPDGDGLANADEYIFGTDPTVAGPAPLLTIAPAGNEITLSFSAKRAEGPGYAGLGRRFTVEATTDLHNPASWSPVEGYSEIPGDNQNITLTLPADGSRRFFRLRIGL